MRNITTESVLEVISETLHVLEEGEDKIEKFFYEDPIDENFDMLQVDSVTFIKIIIALENAFELEVPDEYLLVEEMNCIDKIVEVLNKIIE